MDRMELTVLRVTPLSSGSGSQIEFHKQNTEWLRSAFLYGLNIFRGRFEKSGINFSIFHNHDEQTGKPLNRYPFLHFYRIRQDFFIVGINPGSLGISLLLEWTQGRLECGIEGVLELKEEKAWQQEVRLTEQYYSYSIDNWLPLSTEDKITYDSTSLMGKIGILEKKLTKHIQNDFGRDFELPLTGISVILQDLVYHDSQVRFKYKYNYYLGFTVTFIANALLPSFISLGNGKAFGYGILMRESWIKNYSYAGTRSKLMGTGDLSRLL